jgi:hypothetical protein
VRYLVGKIIHSTMALKLEARDKMSITQSVLV